MQEVRIPTLGESITEGVIVRWLKKDGDQVAQDEPILELETDKANVEIPAPVPGTIHLDRNEGDTVGVGDSVARIEAGAPAASEQSPPAADASEPAAPDTPPREALAPPPATAEPPRSEPSSLPLSPAVRRLVEENQLDPATMAGSGRGGRLTKADILRSLGQRGGDPEVPQPAAAVASRIETSQPAPATSKDATQPIQASSGDEVRTPLTRLRRRIAERLLEAQRGAAILTTFNEVDMSAVLDLRKRFKESFEKRHGTRLGFMSFFARACIAAMEDVPLINARIEGDDIVQPGSVNLGIAVGTDRGLVVPTVHGADKLSFAEIETEVARLAALAQNNKLAIADLTGGTFTISNGGVYGSLMSTPILNPPQSGILGMHKIEKRPVVVDDQIVIRPMMYLALSYDHRLIDGAGAVTFLVRVKERIESPERLLLEV